MKRLILISLLLIGCKEAGTSSTAKVADPVVPIVSPTPTPVVQVPKTEIQNVWSSSCAEFDLSAATWTAPFVYERITSGTTIYHFEATLEPIDGYLTHGTIVTTRTEANDGVWSNINLRIPFTITNGVLHLDFWVYNAQSGWFYSGSSCDLN